MRSSSAMPAGRPPRAPSPTWSPADASPLGWLILLPIGCVILGQILLALSGVAPVLDGLLADPDAYMRLNRVLALHDGGAWFDSRYPRIDPPEGLVQHWTRPLDLLLLAGAWLLQPAFGFEKALHLFGVLLSPLCLLLMVPALAWAARPILDRDGRMFACLALLLQPAVLAYSSLGRPDHHALLLLLATVLLGQVIRLLADPAARGTALAAGLVAALGVWISAEALAFVAAGLVALGLFWLLGDRRLGGTIELILGALALALGLALLIERGPGALAAVENDRLSLIHVAGFGLLAAAWAVLHRSTDVVAGWIAGALGMRPAATPGDPRPAHSAIGIAVRAGGGLGAGLAVALALLVLFPELRQGPLGQVDPLYARLRLQRIVEIQPVISLQALLGGDALKAIRRALEILGIALLALPWLAVALRRTHGAERRGWICVALALAAFLPLALYQVRWSSYAELLLVLPYAGLVAWLCQRLATRLRGGALTLARPLVIVAALFWPLLGVQLLPQQRIETAAAACPVQRLAPALERLAGGASRTVMTFADYGPELLYRTGHSVLSIPNHRPQRGFTATYLVLTRASEGLARTMLAEHGVDWILLCPSAAERSVFASDGGRDTLYARLAEGAPPPWLRPLPLPGDLAGEARLYAIGNAPAMAGKDGGDASRL